MKIVKILVASFLIICISLFAFFWMMLEPKAEWKFIPYDVIMAFGSYDHIVYDSTEYYFMEVEDRRKYIEYKYLSKEEIEIIIVDINGNAFDERRTESAKVYEGDTEREFIIYQGEIYTKNMAFAAYWYEFEK